MNRIIYVQQLGSDVKHILDDSGRLHWDMLCADSTNSAGSWSTGELPSVNCQVCLSIYKRQNEVLEDAGLVRYDAEFLYRGLSEQGNIQREQVQHLIDCGIFTGNPAMVFHWENGERCWKDGAADWTRCELTENGNVIAKKVWHVPFPAKQ